MPNRLDMNRVRKALGLFTLIAMVAIVGACSGGSGEQLLELAKKSHAEGKNGTAMVHLKNALQRNPKDAEARYLLGVIYNEDLQGLSAESELRRASELGLIDGGRVMAQLGRALLLQQSYQKLLDEIKPTPAFEESSVAFIHALRGSAHLGLNQIAAAKQSFDQALALQPEHADALLGKARLAVRDKNLDEAVRLVERAIASAPKSEDAWLLKGDLGRIAGDQAGALAAYGKVIELKPSHLPARENLVSLQIAAGKFDEARKEIDTLRKRLPDSPMVNHMHGLLEFRQKNYPAARDALQLALKVAPDHMPSVLLAGMIEFELGSYGQAQTHLARVLERAPGMLYARKLLVASLVKSGQSQRAIEVLQPGLTQAPDDAELLALAGELYMQANEYAKAAEFLAKAAKQNPKSAGLRAELGRSRLAAGETDRALADLESAVALDSSAYQADVLLVMTHLRRGNHEQALKALQSLEKKQPDNPLTYNLKAGIYLAKKDAASARKYFEQALKLQATYVPAATNLAQFDLQEKNPQAARRRLEAILEKDKNNVEALLALASLAVPLGATPKEEVEWLERARKAAPGAARPPLLLARYYTKAGDGKKALEAAQQAQAASPDNPEVLDALGTIQLGMGLKEQALSTYRRLAVLHPNAPLVLYRLATAQALNADVAAAASSLKKALALKPDFVEARAALADVEIRAGRYAEALQIARQLQKEAAKSPLGYTLEGDVLMAQGKFPQAVATYETAFRLQKQSAIVIKLHGATTQAGKPDEADARLAQWLKDMPEDLEVRAYAAYNALGRGKYKEAIAQYEWLQQKRPDNDEVLNNLAWAYQQVKDKRARETAERAYRLRPDLPAVADTLGWIMVEQGDIKRGVELLKQAVDAAPTALEIRYHLAQALVKSGDNLEARKELEKLVAPSAKFAQRAEAQALLNQLRY